MGNQLTTIVASLTLALAVLIAGPAFAGERHFTYNKEALTHAAGTVEYEQYFTWRGPKDTDDDHTRFDIRHELEIGITDHTQIAFYVDWRYRDGASIADDGAEFRDIAVEVIHNFSHPVNDPVGFSLYAEFKVGPELIEVEGKAIFQKNIGKWILVYNLTLEGEWEGDSLAQLHEKKGEIANTIGVAYQVAPNITIGGELLHEIEYADFSEWEDHVVYVGPVASYHGKGWFVALTVLVQVTDVASAENFQTRLIVGIDF